jgi:hypothetical protein
MAIDHRDIEELAEKVFLSIVGGMTVNHDGKMITKKAYELAEAFLVNKPKI